MTPDPLAVEIMEFARGLTELRTLDEIERCYLDRVRRFIPLPAAGVYLLEDGGVKPWRVASIGVSDFFLSRYEQFGREEDPVLAEVLRTQRPVCNRSLMSAERWRTLRMYKRVHCLHRMTVSLQAPIFVGSKMIGTLNFGGSDDAGHPDERRIALLATLGRLVGSAVQASLDRQAEERRHEQILAALSLSDEAIVISDLSTGERTLNPAAERLLDRLHECSSDSLDRMMAGVRPAMSTIRSRRVLMGDGQTATLQVRVAAHKRWDDVVVCFLQLIDPHAGTVHDHVADRLTERERMVAELVARGKRDREIAEQLHLSQHTVRDHIKSIYRKSGVTNRVALTRMLLLGTRLEEQSIG